MPRILIAGCGYVGAAAADLFHEAGWLVEGWTHSTQSSAQLLDKPYPVIAVDITKSREVNARPENFDIVIHCASTGGGEAEQYRQLYLEGTRNLLDRFVGATLLFTSSTSVYAQSGGEWVTEASRTEPLQETGRILVAAEQLVLGRGGVVIRLAAIHGPARSAFLKTFLAEAGTIDPLSDRYANHIHRDDAATALFLLTDSKFLSGRIYNVADNEPILRSECYRWLAQKLDRALPPVAAAARDAKRGRSNKRVSNRKLRATGWAPRYASFMEAMEGSILPSFGL